MDLIKKLLFLFSWTATADIEEITTNLNSSKLVHILDTIKNDSDIPTPNIFYINFFTEEKSKQIFEINKSIKELKAFL
ncbi:hypothetical protein IB633_03810 [Francisella philomiragia]|uniref:Uncharacterized protein n=1 Tax=Francisella philomiragia subsp. philomiragia (strain ATCC 25017 / CCUG 19701 / FSC 153 / O\|nr:hypothetical protein [Francisella philomiragia]AJI46340.1 hypothetical protein BF30_1003 [Francisella philomiragia]AJI49681.1 hypothetical protein KU46_552 [Francisella philomiragia]MBK2020522.1 hypothetical protein [Francisella philomiragia]MBK2030215.1 hypothetical protein [Francisella philomiragia]MBK2264823.1 hypothetical protein [Francisella philomiragia]